MSDAARALRQARARHLGQTGAFLPGRVPADALPGRLQPYLDACGQLPSRYPEGRGGVRGWLERELPRWDSTGERALDALEEPERDTLLTALAALGHTWRWDTVPPAAKRFSERRIALPEAVEAPWRALSDALGVPMVGSVWSLHLCNWRSHSRPGGAPYRPEELALDDLDLTVQWLPPPYAEQLRHFSLIFVLSEARGAAAVRAAVDAVAAAAEGDRAALRDALHHLRTALDDLRRPMTKLLRSPYVEPAHWLDVVQPTMPWAAELAGGEEPPGPNGLQLPCIQCLDVALDVPQRSELGRAAAAARAQLPPAQREFLATLERSRGVLRSFVQTVRDEELAFRFNDCVKSLRSWRLVHLRRAARFLRAARGSNARVSTGTAVPWRDNADGSAVTARDDLAGADPVAFFETLMSARVADTAAAMVPAVPRGEAPALEDAFALLDADQLATLLAVGEPRHFPAGVTIVREGEREAPLYLLDSGQAELLLGGHVVPDIRIRPGELVGEVAFLDGGAASATVVAREDVETTMFSRARIEALLDGDPLLAAAVYRSLGAMAARRLRARL